jgi:hypothetical protein
VADAYFRVQEARGQVAGTQDVVDKGLALQEKFRSLVHDPPDQTAEHRGRADLAESRW